MGTRLGLQAVDAHANELHVREWVELTHEPSYMGKVSTGISMYMMMLR